ncbi:hypothetical protein BDZ85DRAFT_279189 [Elsinoe ampelina]|uniref:Uncharacterized protein n=1 Tax=Elsinoe ampelina TaxID=302913 RepID=A0A6A6GID0_9PEZI|nr:hypothetical protein BDZ85DRAFT_279189 [Elsinoe ampelina]
MAPKRKASAVSEADSVIDDSHSSKKTKETPQTASASQLEYLTLARPQWDFEREYGDPEDMPRDEFSAQQEKHHKPIADLPEWKWVVSKRADDISARYDLEMQKRDADRWGLYIYNDFTGYGIHELVENQLQRWYEAFSKRNVHEAFFRIEALSHFLCTEDLGAWYNLEDGPRMQNLNNIIVKAFLATFHLIHKNGLLKPDTGLKSLRTCINFFLQYLEEAEEEFFEDPDQANDAPGIFVEDSDVPEDINVDDSRDDPFGVAKDMKELIKRYGHGRPKKIGGTQYDITKMSSAQRKGYAFDKVDPMTEASAQLKEAEREVQGEAYP